MCCSQSCGAIAPSRYSWCRGWGQGLLPPAGTHRAGEQQLPNLSCSFRRLFPMIFLYRILFLCFPILLQVSVCFFRDRNMVSVALTSCLLFLCSLSCGHNEFVFRWHSSRVFPQQCPVPLCVIGKFVLHSCGIMIVGPVLMIVFNFSKPQHFYIANNLFFSCDADNYTIYYIWYF